jgi:hypothetical protein
MVDISVIKCSTIAYYKDMNMAYYEFLFHLDSALFGARLPQVKRLNCFALHNNKGCHRKRAITCPSGNY